MVTVEVLRWLVDARWMHCCCCQLDHGIAACLLSARDAVWLAASGWPHRRHEQLGVSKQCISSLAGDAARPSVHRGSSRCSFTWLTIRGWVKEEEKEQREDGEDVGFRPFGEGSLRRGRAQHTQSRVSVIDAQPCETSSSFRPSCSRQFVNHVHPSRIGRGEQREQDSTGVIEDTLITKEDLSS